MVLVFVRREQTEASRQPQASAELTALGGQRTP
jgi:hypothetical protein